MRKLKNRQRGDFGEVVFGIMLGLLMSIFFSFGGNPPEETVVRKCYGLNEDIEIKKMNDRYIASIDGKVYWLSPDKEYWKNVNVDNPVTTFPDMKWIKQK